MISACMRAARNLFVTALIFLLSGLCVAEPSQAVQDTALRPNTDKVVDAGSQILLRLQRLSDSGDLFNSQSVEQILDLRLTASVRDTKLSDCSTEVGIRDDRETSFQETDDGWYHILRSGAGHMDIPAAFINPAAKTGDAKLEYRVTRQVRCSDILGIQNYTFAQMVFENLPSFACITPAAIRSAMPAAALHMATDGVYMVDYPGRVNDETGTSLRFEYRFGAPCAISATVEQNQKQGLRYLRASAAYAACSADAKRNYCTTHPHPTWGDGVALDDMLHHANKVCGTVNSLYLREPLNGRKPPPPPLQRPPVKQYNSHAGPCDK